MDAIGTSTHTALFAKFLREDGKGLATLGNDATFAPQADDCNELEYPSSTLGLNEIILIENDEILPSGINSLKTQGDDFQYRKTCGGNLLRLASHEGDQVIDVTDSELSFYRSKAIRTIDFDTNYLLVPNTENSIENGDLYKVNNPAIANSGKLTLNSISFGGKSGISLIPPIELEYDIPSPVIPDITFSNFILKSSLSEEFLDVVEVGDILSFEENNRLRNAFITSDEQGKLNLAGAIGDHTFFNSNSHIVAKNLRITKNPGYLQNFYDDWNMYLRRGHKDVWSLRSIRSSLGADIKVAYESDSYSNVVFNHEFQFRALGITDVEDDPYIGDPLLDGQPFGTNIISAAIDGDLSNVKRGDNLNFIYLKHKVLTSNCDQFNPIVGEITTPVLAVQNNRVLFNAGISLNDLPNSCNSPSYILFGYIGLEKGWTRSGGGIRVKKLEIETNDQLYSTIYDYHNSGTTSYEPGGIPIQSAPLVFGAVNPETPDDERILNEATDKYRRRIMRSFPEVFALARELPPPGVVYSKVTTQDRILDKTNGSSVNVPGSTTYEFEVLNKNMIGIIENSSSEELVNGSYEGNLYTKITKKDLALKDYTSRVGSLKSITQNDINGQPITKTTNEYLHDGLEGSFTSQASEYASRMAFFNDQGSVEETNIDARFARRNLIAVVSRRQTYPSIQIGQSVTNYQSGATRYTKNLGFDFYSGQPIKVYTEDTYRNKYVSNTVPAYRLSRFGSYAYPKMGLKADNSVNKNLLTQEGANFTYKLKDSYNPDNGLPSDNDLEGLVSGTIQLWEEGRDNVLSPLGKIAQNNITNGQFIFRKHGTYTYIGDGQLNSDGTYPVDGDISDEIYLTSDGLGIGFGGDANWRKNGEATLYDVNSHVLEVVDINNVYAATKFDSRFEQPYSSATNARYDEFGYSGAEDGYVEGSLLKFGSGEITSGGNINEIGGMIHSGSSSIDLAANQKGFTFDGTINKDRPVKISIWSSSMDAKLYYQIGGGTTVELQASVNRAEANGEEWYQLSGIIPAAFASAEQSLAAWVEAPNHQVYVDDFMIFPIDSDITGYVYNQWGELSDVINRNNLPTHYEYDAMGRLTSIWTESFQYGKKKISETNYHYANQN